MYSSIRNVLRILIAADNILVGVDSEESRMREIESIMAAENSRLRAELERLRHQPQPIIIQQPLQVQHTTHTQF